MIRLNLITRGSTDPLQALCEEIVDFQIACEKCGIPLHDQPIKHATEWLYEMAADLRWTQKRVTELAMENYQLRERMRIQST